ncbi:Protein of unknown function [Pyronema omphalodes CBS 100304]|uniref:Uncharacterized protein n=1 Tax=Pyronema omphalodes (strain CBS 100304) TaxID=1076935 RepID=U4L8X3_PYROM|nr:Protein of unknown function [Pyronema omphalodes CBS 100304]
MNIEQFFIAVSKVTLY